MENFTEYPLYLLQTLALIPKRQIQQYILFTFHGYHTLLKNGTFCRFIENPLDTAVNLKMTNPVDLQNILICGLLCP